MLEVVDLPQHHTRLDRSATIDDDACKLVVARMIHFDLEQCPVE